MATSAPTPAGACTCGHVPAGTGVSPSKGEQPWRDGRRAAAVAGWGWLRGPTPARLEIAADRAPAGDGQTCMQAWLAIKQAGRSCAVKGGVHNRLGPLCGPHPTQRRQVQDSTGPPTKPRFLAANDGPSPPSLMGRLQPQRQPQRMGVWPALPSSQKHACTAHAPPSHRKRRHQARSARLLPSPCQLLCHCWRHCCCCCCCCSQWLCPCWLRGRLAPPATPPSHAGPGG